MVLKKLGEVVLKLALVFCILAGTSVGALAQGQAQTKFETFTAKTANMSVGAGLDVKIDVFRWSTDEERNALLSALKEKADAGLAEAIQKAPSLGSIWTNESLGYSIRYAYRDALPNGSERVILLTDRRFGSWSGQIWKPMGKAEAVDYPFSLVELRLNKAGTGEGKLSLTTKVVADEGGKTLILSGYETAPVLLRTVKRESAGPSS